MADISKITTLDGVTYDVKAIRSNGVPIATVDSTSTSTAFTVQVPEFSNEIELRDGLFFYIYNDKVASKSGWTLDVNGLGAKPVYNTSAERTTTGFAKNRWFPIWYSSSLVTDGCWIIGYLTDANTDTLPNTIRHYNNILAKTSIAANSLICGDSSGYQAVAAGVTFDITYPLIWCNADVSSNTSNYKNMYLMDFDKNLGTIKSGYTSTAGKIIYLVMTVSSNTCTIVNDYLTDSLPSSDDGNVYVVLGRLGAQSTGANYFIFYPTHEKYWYKNGAVRSYGDYGNPLPTVTSSDNGKVLQVVNGAWSAVQLPSASGVSF